MKTQETTNSDFAAALSQKAGRVNEVIRELIDQRVDLEPRIQSAMRHVLEAGGKRVRSVLVLMGCEIFEEKANRNAEVAAAAIEMVHTYSLVHDDLPAMDDDDLRRGLPTCHKAFDEATAILAGDALLTMAFEVLASEIDDPSLAVKLIQRLCEDAGGSGMIAGQMADLIGEQQEPTMELLEYIHMNKTAKMFRCAALFGGLCGSADMESLERLNRYGLKIGLGFQVADDILDISQSSEHLGKTAGKDEQADKCTYPALVGMEASRGIAEKLANDAIEELKPFGRRGAYLKDLALVLLRRTK